MLEDLPSRKRDQGRLDLTKTARPLFRQFSQDGTLELSRSAPGPVLAPVHAIAEHFCHDLFTAQKMDLKAVRLFLCPRLGIDAADILF